MMSSSSRLRRKRSLTGLELYNELGECYSMGWHHRLQELEKSGNVATIVSHLSTKNTEPGFVEFAVFHNSQLMEPMPCLGRALKVIDRAKC